MTGRQPDRPRERRTRPLDATVQAELQLGAQAALAALLTEIREQGARAAGELTTWRVIMGAVSDLAPGAARAVALRAGPQLEATAQARHNAVASRYCQLN